VPLVHSGWLRERAKYNHRDALVIFKVHKYIFRVQAKLSRSLVVSRCAAVLA